MEDARPVVDWEQVYWEQLPRIYNFFRYRLCDDQLAEDLTATTFEKAWRQRDRYCPHKGAVTTWLFTIARHVAVDYLRKACPEISLDTDTAAHSPPLDDLVQHHSDLARLAQLIAQLSDRERDLISLKYGADLTNREIARLTDLSESNVAVILYRAIHRMRVMWEPAP